MQTLPDHITTSLRPARARAFGERLGGEEWRYLSSGRMLDRARSIACALRYSGIERGDRVALISNNRLDWIAANFGILLAGCVVVPIFATLAADQVDYIFEDSDAKLAFVESEFDIERLRSTCEHLPRTVHFDGTGPDSLATFEARGAAHVAAGPAIVATFSEALDPSELAVLIYTSGTTGNPKGVMLTHDNLTSNAKDTFAYAFDGIAKDDPVLSVLPFAHIYEFTLLLGFIQYDCSLHVTQPDFLVADLKEVRPVTMALVPRIYERLLAAIVGKAKAEGGLRARLVPWALGIAREHAAASVEGRRPSVVQQAQYALAHRLVLSKVKPALGLDRVHWLASGSAPLHRDIALTFAGLGIPICEGYGLTETSPVVTATRQDGIRYGSVGKPIPNVTLKIAADGEILVKGPNVMKGYYHLPGEQPISNDGWFSTGDIGEIDKDGYLFITDRKKELIKTSGGKYIAPGRVESSIKRSIYIAQVLVIGDGRPFPAALVVPNWDLVRKEFALAPEVSTSEIAGRQDVLDFIRAEVRERTADLATFEQVRRIALLPRDLTVEEGDLSPTLKVKRRVVEKRFAESIAAAYADSETAVSARAVEG